MSNKNETFGGEPENKRKRPANNRNKNAEELELFPTSGRLPRARRPVRDNAQTGETRLFDAVQAPNEETKEPPEESQPLFTEKERRRPFILSVLFTTIRFMLLGALLLGFGALGAGIGLAKAYVDTTPKLDRSMLTKSDRSSFIYDKDGVLITTLADVEYRDWVDFKDIPDRLANAFIAVEDVRFYKHNGVDFKRLFSAALEVLGNSDSSGGSTITQQLIKNKILDPSERTYKRKIQEASLALELEKEIDKDLILEAYLNDIHLGESNYGVKTAAKDYFGKELKDLTVRECALLAGLTQNPYYYNPRLNKYKREAGSWERTVKRTDNVLSRMYKAGFITGEEYERALHEDVYINEVSEQRQMYDMPYFIEYAIRDVVTHILAQRGLTEADRNAVENELRTSGYHIYTTVDREMQHLVQDTLSTWDQYPPLKYPNQDVKRETLANGEVLSTIQPQASAVVMDYHTGELRVIVGGRDTPTIRKGWNRAYQSYMEVGSSIKPLAVYGPAFDAGASPGTIIGNFKAPITGWTKDPGYPYIGEDKYIGPLSIRQGIVSSLNVMAARTLMERVSPEVGAKYLTNLGANPSKINADGPGLALGTSGLTTIQMTAAFGAIAAQGEYLEPLSFTKVLDAQGNVVLDADVVRRRMQVYKPSTAYMLVDVLTDAVNRGTGTNAKIDGITVAGKTGTNDDYKSVYFAGMTPYYASAVWIGHDDPSVSPLKNRSAGGAYAAPLWQAFMSQIHKGLPDKPIIDTPPSALGLVKKRVCSVSGMLATEACDVDSMGHKPITDWFLESNAPTEPCNMHAAVSVCSESGMIASPNCPTTSLGSASMVLIQPGSYYDQFTDEELQGGLTNYIRTTLPLEAYVEGMGEYYGQQCTLHNGYNSGGWNSGAWDTDPLTPGTGSVQQSEDELEERLKGFQNQARQMRVDMQEYLATTDLTTSDKQILNKHIAALSAVESSRSERNIQNTMQQAQADWNFVQSLVNGSGARTGP